MSDSLNRDLTFLTHTVHGRTLGGYTLRFRAVRTRYAEQFRIVIHLDEPSGATSIHPLFSGVLSLGRRNWRIPGWFDGEYVERLPVGKDVVDLSQAKLDVDAFRVLGRLAPPGGSLMISYSMFAYESRVHTETSMGLQLGLPPAVTPLGFLLFEAGCMSVRDWYIAEGGTEGPPKLWGRKPLDAEDEAQRSRSLSLGLEKFIAFSAQSGHPVFRDAVSRASLMLSRLAQRLPDDCKT